MEHIEFQGKQYHLVCGGCGVKLTYEIVDGDYVIAPHECVMAKRADFSPVNPDTEPRLRTIEPYPSFDES